MEKQFIFEGNTFHYNKREYKITCISTSEVFAKPVIPEPSTLRIPIERFETLTGFAVKPKEKITVTPAIREEAEIVRKAELIRFMGGENGKQYIDRYISDGYVKIEKYKVGNVNKYYLINEKTNFQIPISGNLRKYTEFALKKSNNS